MIFYGLLAMTIGAAISMFFLNVMERTPESFQFPVGVPVAAGCLIFVLSSFFTIDAVGVYVSNLRGFVGFVDFLGLGVLATSFLTALFTGCVLGSLSFALARKINPIKYIFGFMGS